MGSRCAFSFLPSITLSPFSFTSCSLPNALIPSHFIQLEKRQHLYRDGTLKPTKQYVSKLAKVAEEQRAAGVPEELLNGVGGFPVSKKAVEEAIEEAKRAPPALPPRKEL